MSKHKSCRDNCDGSHCTFFRIIGNDKFDWGIKENFVYPDEIAVVEMLGYKITIEKINKCPCLECRIKRRYGKTN